MIRRFLQRLWLEEGGWTRIWYGLATAMVIAGGGLIYNQTQGGGTPPAGTANLWIDTNGGTCTRQGTPAAYSDAAACSSFDAAYSAASLGDLVLVKAGAYAAQTITDEASKDSTGNLADVVIAAASGETVTVTDMVVGGTVGGTDGPDHLTIRGIADDSPSSGDCEWEIQDADIYDVTLDNVTTCNLYINLETGDSTNVSDGLTIENSEFVGCTTSAGYNCGNIKVDGADQFTFQNNYVHDFHIGNVNDHFECMFISDTDSATVQGNTFEDCSLYDIMLQTCNPANGGRCILSNVTIQNNFFDAVWNGEPSSPAQGARQTGVNFATDAVTNFLIRYNSFADATSVTDENGATHTNTRIIGNIQEGTCITGPTYDYNIYLGGPECGTNATSDTAANLYVNAAYGASGDKHLKSGTNTAVGYVTPTSTDYAVDDDIDGDTRTAPRDAGADKR